MSKMIDRLRLGAGAQAVALADLTGKDLAGNLSDEQKASLAAELDLVPKAEAEPEAKADAPKDAPKDKKKDGEDDDAGDDGAKAADPAHAQFAHGVAAERARCAAVFASEHYAGREAQANEMLGTSMSADEIGRVLAKAPKGSGDNNMLGNLQQQAGNPDLGGGGGGDDADRQAEASGVWDRVAVEGGWGGQS